MKAGGGTEDRRELEKISVAEGVSHRAKVSPTSSTLRDFSFSDLFAHNVAGNFDKGFVA